MTLLDWLQKHGMNQAELARNLEISDNHLSQVMSGNKRPSFELLVRLHNTTRGQVSFRDLAGSRLVA